MSSTTDAPTRRRGVVLLLALALAVSLVPLPSMAAEHTDAQRVSIAEIQTPTGDSGDSPYAGQNVTTTGTVTAVNPDGFYVQNGTANHSGVYVYGSADTAVAVGDTVSVTGLAKEYYGVTELDITGATGNVSVTGSSAVPEPRSLSTGEAAREAYEGMLVRVTDATATSTPDENGEWDIDDGSGALAVDDVTTGSDTTPAETGATVDALVGPLFYSFGEYKVQPESIDGFEPAGDEGRTDAPANGTRLSVVSYNDLQTAVSDPTTMGRLAGLLNERRAAHENPTLVVGGGDQVSPSSLSPVSNWTVPVGVLNRIDPAAEVVGNHDLDFGFDSVSAFSNASAFPWLLANVRAADGSNVPGTRNYTVVERGNVSIGVVGLVDDAVKTKTAVDFEANGYEVTDFVDAGSRIATELKTEANVDFVVAAAHIGVSESEALARNTENIDLIVTGDDEVRHEPQTTDGTVIMEAGGNAEAVAEANFTVSDAGARFESGRLHTVDDTAPTNETVRSLVADARGEYLSTVAGETTVPLDSTATNYEDETAWGNLIGDAFLAQTGADVALTNAGGIRGDFVIEPGPVTYNDVYTSLPFGNTLVTKALNGTELRRLLASQVGWGEQYGFEAALQVGGVRYDANARTDGIPVTDVYVQGEPLDPDATYNVTLNSYMAGWTALSGEPYSVNVSGQPTVNTNPTLYGTAVVEYIEANSPVSPSDTNRIRRVSRDLGNGTLTATEGRLQATFDLPESVMGVNASTVHARNASAATVSATDVSYDGDAGTLTVGFERSAFTDFAAASEDVQLYGEYDTDTFDLVAFEHAVLNADLDISDGAVDGGDTTTPDGTTTQSDGKTTGQERAATGTPTPTEVSGSGGAAGFGVGVAAFVLAAGVLLGRR